MFLKGGNVAAHFLKAFAIVFDVAGVGCEHIAANDSIGSRLEEALALIGEEVTASC